MVFFVYIPPFCPPFFPTSLYKTGRFAFRNGPFWNVKRAVPHHETGRFITQPAQHRCKAKRRQRYHPYCKTVTQQPSRQPELMILFPDAAVTRQQIQASIIFTKCTINRYLRHDNIATHFRLPCRASTRPATMALRYCSNAATAIRPRPTGHKAAQPSTAFSASCRLL